MKKKSQMLAGSLFLAVTGPASAGWVVHNPISVPVDSPWALAGLGVLTAVIVARIMRKR